MKSEEQKMKKLLAMVLALMMVFSLTALASAFTYGAYLIANDGLY